MIDRTTFERGSRFARDVVFNDVSALSGAGGTEPDGPDLELGRGPVQVLPTRLLAFVHETEPLLRIGLWADPALFAPGEAEGFLTGLVRLLEAAAEGDVPLASLTGVTGVRPVERGPDWLRTDGCWSRRRPSRTPWATPSEAYPCTSRRTGPGRASPRSSPPAARP